MVGNGVAPEFTPEGSHHYLGYPYLLYVGNRKPHKNLPRLLKAYSSLKIGEEVRMMVSGGPDEATINMMTSLGIEDRVVFAGLIPDKALPSYYRGALALVFPSLYEGFGLPSLEAMACGCPVVVSNTSSLPEVCGDAAFYVNPTDVQSIVNGVREVLQNKRLRETLIENGLKRAKLFTWDHVAQKILNVLEEAISC